MYLIFKGRPRPQYRRIYKIFIHVLLEIFTVEQHKLYLLKRVYCAIWTNDLYQIALSMFLPRRFAKQTSIFAYHKSTVLDRTFPCRNVDLMSFSSPEPTILLACGWDRELWFGPTPEVRDSRTSRQIQQIWLVDNAKRILCACSGYRVRPELSIPTTGQKDRRLWGREWLNVYVAAHKHY